MKLPAQLTKRVGPLPVWGWAMIVLGGGATILWLRSRSRAAAAASGQTPVSGGGLPGAPGYGLPPGIAPVTQPTAPGVPPAGGGDGTYVPTASVAPPGTPGVAAGSSGSPYVGVPGYAPLAPGQVAYAHFGSVPTAAAMQNALQTYEQDAAMAPGTVLARNGNDVLHAGEAAVADAMLLAQQRQVLWQNSSAVTQQVVIDAYARDPVAAARFFHEATINPNGVRSMFG